MNRATGEITRCSRTVAFEDVSVGELREMYESDPISVVGVPEFDAGITLHLDGPDDGPVEAPPGLCTQELQIFEAENDTPQPSGELLTLNWRSEPEDLGFKDRKWVRVKSVVDSGAGAEG